MIVDEEPSVGHDLNRERKVIKQIHVCPCVMGRFIQAAIKWVTAGLTSLGVAAGVASVVATVAVTFAFSLAVGLIVAGIAYLLTPIPETEPDEASIEASIKNSSFVFQTPQNVSAQGKAVPVGYGRLRVGSLVVGQNITNYDLSNDIQQNIRYDSFYTDALLKIQAAFGSSTANYIRGY
jgi:predicted phage tail protein